MDVVIISNLWMCFAELKFPATLRMMQYDIRVEKPLCFFQLIKI